MAGNFIPDSEFKPDAQPSAEEQANAAQSSENAEQSKYGIGSEQVKAGLEAAGRGVAGPLATAAETADPDTLTPILNRLGPVGRIAGIAKQMIGKVNPEDIRGREEANPVTSAAGTMAGLLTPGGQGSLLESAGSKLVSGIAEKGVLRGMTKGAIKLSAENAMFQAGDETSKMLLNDPNQSVGTAISNIGLAAAIGGVAGGAIGAVNPLWKLASGTKTGEFINDFKARMREHLDMAPEMPQKSSESVADSANRITKPTEAYDPFMHKTTTLDKIVSDEPPVRSNFDPFTKTTIEQPVVVKTHSDVNPNIPPSQTPGGKLADKLVAHSDDLITRTAAGGIGGAIGHMSGIPYGGTIGALLGERVLSPLFKSVLPTIGKRLLEQDVSAEGIKAAAEYGANVVKGEKLASVAVKNTFGSGNVLPEYKYPNTDTRKKLDSTLQTYQQNPDKLANIGQNIGHYMPQHAMAIGMTASNAVNFLNSIRPQAVQRAPLDPPLKPSQAVQAQYDRVLDIAQQPLVVLDAIKQGTLTSHDVMALHTLYPELYASLRTKVMAQMVDTIAKHEIIPYQTRLGLGMFLQQPLDSTMKPMAIALAQPIVPNKAENQNIQPKKVSDSAASNQIKSNKSYQTASQSSESMHSTQKA